jgi:hypothetical protein
VLYRAKSVAGIVVQIISMQAVFGSLVRLRTRELYKCIIHLSSAIKKPNSDRLVLIYELDLSALKKSLAPPSPSSKYIIIFTP